MKPQKRTRLLRRRPDSDLIWAADEPLIGGPLLLDTCVYLDILQGHAPEGVDSLITRRLCHHSAVCLAELTHVFGRLDPAHPATPEVLREIGETIEDISAHRLHEPGVDVWGEAGMLAGALARLSGAPRDAGQERKFLNDAIIGLQARWMGASVVTGNVRDFDFLSQIVPDLRVIFHRQSLRR